MFPAAVLLIVLAAPPASEPADAFRRAERLYAAERFGEAEPLYQAALATEDRFLKRDAYNRLIGVYTRSGRPDKALNLVAAFQAWLKKIGETNGFAALDLLAAQCRLELGYPDAAEKLLAGALAAKPPLTPDRRLEALRLCAEVAVQRKDAGEKQWAELETAAAKVLKDDTRTSDGALRVTAARYLAEALYRRGDAQGALAALAPFPEHHTKFKEWTALRDVQRQRAKLTAATGKFPEAEALFREALALHQKHQPKRRLLAGDILAEWSAAALAAGKSAEAAKLRDAAAVEYRAALDAPADNPDPGGSLAAFVRLQGLTRSAKQFAQALDVTRSAGERWSGDALLDARLKSDRGGLELIGSAYQLARKLLTQALANLDASDPPNLRALPQVLVNLATAELGCEAPGAPNRS